MTAGVLVALGTVYVVWGSTYLAIKYIVGSLPPFLSMGARFLLAGALLTVMILVSRGRPAFGMTRSQFVTAALCGLFLLVGGNGLVAVAEQDVDSSMAALLIAGTPLWVVLLRALLRDRPSLATVAGLAGRDGRRGRPPAAGRAGDGGARPAPAGRASPRCCGRSGPSWPPAGRCRPTRSSPPSSRWRSAARRWWRWARSAASGAAWTWARAEPSAWIAFVYLVVVGSVVGYSAYVWLLARAPLSLATTYAYVNPAVAVLLGALFLSEPLTVERARRGSGDHRRGRLRHHRRVAGTALADADHAGGRIPDRTGLTPPDRRTDQAGSGSVNRIRGGAPARRTGASHRAGRAGLRRAAAGDRGRYPAAAADDRAARGDPDRLGERAVPVALPARLQPAGRLSAYRARRPDRAPARGVRVLGARGVVPARPPPAAPALAHGRGREARLGQHGPAAAGAAGLRRRGARAGPRRPVRSRPAISRSPGPTGPGSMWNWHDGKVALEWLFFTGEITATHRTTAFEKVYDLTERVLPPDVLHGADTGPGRGGPRARPHGRPRARAWPPSATCATTSGSVRRPPARRSPNSPTPGSCCRSRWPAGVRRPGSTRRRAVPGGSGPGPC